MTAVTGILCALEDFAAVFGLLSVLHFLLQKELHVTKPRLIAVSLLLLLPAAVILIWQDLPEPYDGLPDFLATLLYWTAACLLTSQPRPLRLFGITIFYTFTVEVFWGLIAYYTTHALWLEYTACAVLYVLTGTGVRLAASSLPGKSLHRFVAAIPKWNYAVLILFEVMCYYKAYGERTERFDAFFLIASAALILTVLYMLYQIMHLSREESELLRQRALQKEYMESAITDDEELRRFRHDYKNHMLVVNTLLESGKTEEARSYLSAMQEPLQDAMHKIKSGNLVADTILNHKAQTAAQEQTALHFVGHIPAEGIRSDDLCTIFSNLLDNAVEACRRSPGDKQIFVDAKTAQGNFLLSITNPTQGEPPDNARRTTKADRRNHGFGLKNVERAVKKYGGTLQIGVQNGMFSADVLLHLPKRTTTE